MSISAREIAAAGGFEAWHKRESAKATKSRFSKTREDSICGVKKNRMKSDMEKQKNERKSGKESKIRLSEHEEQVALFAEFRKNQEKYPELESAFAVPNGGQRHVAVAAKLKAEGVKAGVPDIFIPAPRGNSHGLFVELKARGGYVSDHQRYMMALLCQQGYACIVSYGWKEAWKEIEEYLQSDKVELWAGII